MYLTCKSVWVCLSGGKGDYRKIGVQPCCQTDPLQTLRAAPLGLSSSVCVCVTVCVFRAGTTEGRVKGGITDGDIIFLCPALSFFLLFFVLLPLCVTSFVVYTYFLSNPIVFFNDTL